MLEATKTDIIYSFHKSSIELQWREIEYFMSALKKLSTVSGILTGFNLSVLCIAPSTTTGSFLERTHLLIGCFSVGCFLLCLIMSMCLIIWAPGLALQGSRGTSDILDAVTEMDRGLQLVFTLFCCGLGTHFIVCMLTVIIKHSFVCGSVIGGSIIIIASARIIIESNRVLQMLLPETITTAVLLGNLVYSNPKCSKYNSKEHEMLQVGSTNKYKTLDNNEPDCTDDHVFFNHHLYSSNHDNSRRKSNNKTQNTQYTHTSQTPLSLQSIQTPNIQHWNTSKTGSSVSTHKESNFNDPEIRKS